MRKYITFTYKPNIQYSSSNDQKNCLIYGTTNFNTTQGGFYRHMSLVLVF